MSSKNRSSDPTDLDVYYTPPFCVHRLLESCALPGGLWLDAGAGSGAILAAVNEKRSDVVWVASELRVEEEGALRKLTPHVVIGDFLGWSPTDVADITFPLATTVKFEVGIANPPFSKAKEFLDKMLECCEYVVLLQRLNFLGSKARATYFQEHAPDVYVLPNRPIFTGTNGDSIEYAWFVYGPDNRDRRRGFISLLGLTPIEERSGRQYKGNAQASTSQPKKPRKPRVKKISPANPSLVSTAVDAVANPHYVYPLPEGLSPSVGADDPDAITRSTVYEPRLQTQPIPEEPHPSRPSGAGDDAEPPAVPGD